MAAVKIGSESAEPFTRATHNQSRIYSPAWREAGESGRNGGRWPERPVQCSQQVLPALAGRVEDGRDDRLGVRAPVRAEATRDFAMDDGRAQRLFRGVVRGRHGRVIEEDE